VGTASRSCAQLANNGDVTIVTTKDGRVQPLGFAVVQNKQAVMEARLPSLGRYSLLD
jgi:hypothetical protein